MARKGYDDRRVDRIRPRGPDRGDAVRAEIAEAQRAARRKGKDKPAVDVDRPTAAILPILPPEKWAQRRSSTRPKKSSSARELQESRQRARQAGPSGLPVYVKEYVLEGRLRRPQARSRMPLDDLVTFYGKLARYAREHHDAKARSPRSRPRVTKGSTSTMRATR